MPAKLGQQDSGWGPGPAAVALGLLALIGAVTVSAIFHYDTVDDALKFWSALSGLIGVVTGAFVAYFFTRETVETAKQGTAAVQETATRNNAVLKDAVETAKQGTAAVQETARQSTAVLQDAVETAQQHLNAVGTEAEQARAQAIDVQQKLDESKTALASAMSLIDDPKLLARLRDDQAVSRALESR
jgi:hypothetical protein